MNKKESDEKNDHFVYITRMCQLPQGQAVAREFDS